MMLEVIVKQNMIIYVMGALFVIGILAKFVSVCTVRRLVREAKDIHNSNHRLMKLVKAKFEHASMVSDRVQNVNAFVNKFMYEHKVLGMRLHTLQNLSAKMMWGIGVLGVVAIFESYRIFGLEMETIQHIRWTSFFFLLLGVLQIAKEEQTSLKVMNNYMVEYLENVCVHRYMKKQQAEVEVEKTPEPEPPIETVKIEEIQEDEESKRSEQEMRIRAILEEFLA